MFNYMLRNRVFQLCLRLSWAGGARLGILWQREISDVETWGGAPQSFFYGRGGVRLEIDRCRVIGAGSHLKQPDYHC